MNSKTSPSGQAVHSSMPMKGNAKNSWHRNETGTQSDAIVPGHCASCSDIECVVQTVNEAIHSCLEKVGNYWSWSNRIELPKNSTQLEKIVHSNTDIRIACKSIVENIRLCLRKNLELKSNLSTIKTNLCTQSTEHEASINNMTKELLELNKKLTREMEIKNKARTNLANLEKDYNMLKSTYIEHKEQRNVSETNTLQRDRDRLRQECVTLSQTILKVKGHCETSMRDKDRVKMALSGCQEMLTKEKISLERKHQALALTLKNVKSRNETLREEMSQIKKEMFNTNTGKNEKCPEKTEEELERLKLSLKNCQSKINLLKSFPDMNGPILAKHGNGDLSVTMQQQFLANDERIKLLKAQNKKLQDLIQNAKVLQGNSNHR